MVFIAAKQIILVVNGLKQQQSYYYLIASMGHKFGMGSVRWIWLGIFYMVIVATNGLEQLGWASISPSSFYLSSSHSVRTLSCLSWWASLGYLTVRWP